MANESKDQNKPAKSTKKLENPKTEETHQVILQVAQRLFFEHGYRSVTTRDVAEACGLSQPALYHHFSNKQDLYLAVFTQHLRQMKPILERIARRNDSLEERLRLVLLCLLNNVKYNLNLMYHDIETELSPDQQALIGQAFEECLLGPITTIFAEGIAQGQLRGPDEGGVVAEMGAYLFLNLITNFLGPNREDRVRYMSRNNADLARLLVQVQLHGLAKPATPFSGDNSQSQN